MARSRTVAAGGVGALALVVAGGLSVLAGPATWVTARVTTGLVHQSAGPVYLNVPLPDPAWLALGHALSNAVPGLYDPAALLAVALAWPVALLATALLLAPVARRLSRQWRWTQWGALTLWALWWLGYTARVTHYSWMWVSGGFRAFPLREVLGPVVIGSLPLHVVSEWLEPGYWLAVAAVLVGALGLALVALAIRRVALASEPSEMVPSAAS